jgi:hypothetical protein
MSDLCFGRPEKVERNPDLHLREVVGQRPPYILLGEAYYGNSLLQISCRRDASRENSCPIRGDAAYLMAHGYREKYRFCGKQPVHFDYSEQDCELILEPMTRREEKQQGNHRRPVSALISSVYRRTR